MFFTNVFFMFFIIGYKTCFLVFIILTSMFFYNYDLNVLLVQLTRCCKFFLVNRPTNLFCR